MIVTDEQDAAIHRVIDSISVVEAWTEFPISLDEVLKKYGKSLKKVSDLPVKKTEYKYYNQIQPVDPTRLYPYYETKVSELCDKFHSEKTFDDLPKLMGTPIWALVMMSVQAIRRTKDSYMLLDKSVKEVEQMAENGDDGAIMMLPVVKVLNRIKEGK